MIRLQSLSEFWECRVEPKSLGDPVLRLHSTQPVKFLLNLSVQVAELMLPPAHSLQCMYGIILSLVPSLRSTAASKKQSPPCPTTPKHRLAQESSVHTPPGVLFSPEI